ncbi:type I-E CRISPR-associated protein Cse1/CasA [Glycomyces harbinensis]|uniref:type I-E CRISPR-associated protein Cse1/CasA n=1 Tax=Glycomyces harbinensis TaxID=58114 RepID=UPI0015A67411|nr:type I-E CRISPR-associated protein Cse1/CasA [Glycomyces harbinensis]
MADSAWIPAVLQNGEHRVRDKLSLRDALVRSDRVLRLDLPLETMLPALLRHLFLPVVMRASGAPKDELDWVARFEAGPETSGLAAAVDGYLKQWHEQFDLFDPERPFAQLGAGRLPAADRAEGLTKLVTTLATGNNVPLFTSTVEGQGYTMTPGDAALWLIHTLCWDTGGPKPSPKDGVGAGPLGILGVAIPEGRNLFETIMLNLPILGGGLEPDDLPHWELPPRAYEGRVRTDLRPGHRVRLFTQLSRSIRLVPDDADDPRTVVGALVFPGIEYSTVPEYEPHTVWARKGKKGEAGTFVAKRHPHDHGTWWGLQSLLALPRKLAVSKKFADDEESERLARQLQTVAELAKLHLPIDFPLTVSVYGAKYTSPPGRCEGIFHDRIPVPVAALMTERDWPERNAIAAAAGQIHDMAKALDQAWDHLRKAAGGDGGGDKGLDPTDLLLDRIDPLARRYLRALQICRGDGEAVRLASWNWERGLRGHALDVFEELLAIVGPRAVAGRTVTEEKTTREYSAAAAETAIWAAAKTHLRLQSEHPEGTTT